MSRFKKILLIAKPWRGGLANYVFSALDELAPGRVEWIATRPTGLTEVLSYRRNRKDWNLRLLEKIDACERDCALFINPPAGFSTLRFHAGNVAWVTDGPQPGEQEYAPYGQIYLSDPGYLGNFQAYADSGQLKGELGFACCPSMHTSDLERTERRLLCFIGNKDAKRTPYLQTLLSQGIDLSVFGNYFFRHPLYWKYPRSFRPSVANRKMGSIYAAYKIALNIHAQIVRHGTNMRTFECAAYGIPQLVEKRPGLECFFTPGEEIITFSNQDELKENLLWLQGDQPLRRKIAFAAQKRVLAEHTYKQRMQKILHEIRD